MTPQEQVSIEIIDNLNFSQIWHGETFQELHNIGNVKNLLPQIKTFGMVKLFKSYIILAMSKTYYLT